MLEGDELVDSNLDIRFKVDQPKTTVCTLAIDKAVELEFIDAVRHLYWYQVYMDDLPQWGMVGEWVLDDDDPEKAEALIYTHKNIDIGYEVGRNRILQLNLTSENPQPVKRGSQLDFTYAVQWSPMPGKWEDRFDRYLDDSFFENQIHWFSIFNSFMMVIFLAGLVSLILMRTLRKDYAKYAAEDDDFDVPGASDDSGWKQVHGDVFRMPPMLSLLCAAVGNGLQLSLLCIICIVMAILRHLYAGRGSTVTVFIVFYALTSVVGGFVSGSLYAQAAGPSWQRAMFLSATLFPGLVLGISFLVNFVSWHYETLHAIPFGTMVVVLLIWVCVSIPLTMAGTIVGRNWCGEPNHPCRVNPIPRYIPGNRPPFPSARPTGERAACAQTTRGS